MAEIVNDTLEKPVFPLFPLRRTATPLEPQI
jgi:hypothetical protein